MKNMTESERSGKRRLSKFARAFIILFAVFLTAGFFTLGSFRSTGKTFGYVAGDDSLAAFKLNMTEEAVETDRRIYKCRQYLPRTGRIRFGYGQALYFRQYPNPIIQSGRQNSETSIPKK